MSSAGAILPTLLFVTKKALARSWRRSRASHATKKSVERDANERSCKGFRASQATLRRAHRRIACLRQGLTCVRRNATDRHRERSRASKTRLFCARGGISSLGCKAFKRCLRRFKRTERPQLRTFSAYPWPARREKVSRSGHTAPFVKSQPPARGRTGRIACPPPVFAYFVWMVRAPPARGWGVVVSKTTAPVVLCEMRMWNVSGVASVAVAVKV